jgi:hypothetical protein
MQVDDARHAQRASYDGQRVVPVAHGDLAPGGKIVGLADFVDDHGRAPVQKDESAARCRELDGLKKSIEHEHPRAKDVGQLAPRAGREKGVHTPPKDPLALRWVRTNFSLARDFEPRRAEARQAPASSIAAIVRL